MIQMAKILHPTDFSEPSRHALDYAIGFAEKFGGKVYVLHVIEEVASARHPERRGDRCRGVPRVERVVRALLSPGKPRDPAVLPERAEPLAPAGQELVRVALVADVPDDAISRGVEDVVERERELDDTQARGEVASVP